MERTLEDEQKESEEEKTALTTYIKRLMQSAYQKNSSMNTQSSIIGRLCGMVFIYSSTQAVYIHIPGAYYKGKYFHYKVLLQSIVLYKVKYKYSHYKVFTTVQSHWALRGRTVSVLAY